MNAFSALIRHRRLEIGKTQRQIAEAIGIRSADFISLVEQGHRRIHLDRLPRLADALDLDLTQLWQLALEARAPELAAALNHTPSAASRWWPNTATASAAPVPNAPASTSL